MSFDSNIDFNLQLKRLTAHFLRGTIFISFMQSAMKVLKDVNDLQVTLTTDIDFFLRWNSQIITLTKFLNTVYDPVLERIYIQDLVPIANTYIFRNIESATPFFLFRKSEPVPAVFLRRFSEIQGDLDYTIFFPATITIDTDLVTSQVKDYNAAGMRFDIQTF